MFIKAKQYFDDIISAVYDSYCLADDETLSPDAQELKKHYKYVIDDLVLHDALEFVPTLSSIEESKHELKKLLNDYFTKNSIYKVDLVEGDEVKENKIFINSFTEPDYDDIVNIVYGEEEEK